MQNEKQKLEHYNYHGKQIKIGQVTQELEIIIRIGKTWVVYAKIKDALHIDKILQIEKRRTLQLIHSTCHNIQN